MKRIIPSEDHKPSNAMPVYDLWNNYALVIRNPIVTYA